MQQPADVGVRPAIKHVPRSVVRDAHKRIVRCGLRIVPVSSETEDKFEDAMEVTASSPLVKIDRVEIRSTTHLSLREHISCVHFLRGQSRGFWVKTLWQQTASTQRCGEAVNRERADSCNIASGSRDDLCGIRLQSLAAAVPFRRRLRLLRVPRPRHGSARCNNVARDVLLARRIRRRMSPESSVRLAQLFRRSEPLIFILPRGGFARFRGCSHSYL